MIWIAGAGAIAAAAAAVALIVYVPRPTQPAPSSTDGPAQSAARPDADAQPPLTPEERQIVDAAISSGRVPIATAVTSLLQPSGPLMGGAPAEETFGPLSPIALVVDADRPTFQWRPSTGRAQYRVGVFDERFDPVVQSDWTSETRWTPDRPLARGQTYSWQITARIGARELTAPAPPAPEARFIVSSAAQHDEIAALRQRAAGSPIALAILLARAGLLDDAERELNGLIAGHPDSTDASRLQASLRAQRSGR